MSDEAIRQPQRGLTFDDVWAALMELREYQKETDRQMREAREETERQARAAREETDRQIRAAREETERQAREAREETERQARETDQKRQEAERLARESWEKTEKELRESAKRLDKQMGDLGLRFGDFTEEMVKAGILDKVNALGYRYVDFDDNYVLRDSNGRRLAEIDLVLYDGDSIMAVEVKTKLTTEDVKDHVQRLEKMRSYSQYQVWNNKKLLGAVAGAIVSDNVRDYAFKQGFFVVSQSGETCKVEPPEPTIREW
ncbi:hypothetical protein FACS1894151_04270 [Spirochaetia bacterium]|nr:hypothetical protein FACS1894151_04270 [Spirochaetia bacterium]